MDRLLSLKGQMVLAIGFAQTFVEFRDLPPPDDSPVVIELTDRGRRLVDEVTARRRRAIEGIVRAIKEGAPGTAMPPSRDLTEADRRFGSETKAKKARGTLRFPSGSTSTKTGIALSRSQITYVVAISRHAALALHNVKRFSGIMTALILAQDGRVGDAVKHFEEALELAEANDVYSAAWLAASRCIATARIERTRRSASRLVCSSIWRRTFTASCRARSSTSLTSWALAWAALGVTMRFALFWLPVVIVVPFALALLVTGVSAVALLVAAVVLHAEYGTFSLPELIERGFIDSAPAVHPGLRLFSGELSHVRYLKVSEGCDHGCAFCAIPLMRGKHRSFARDEIVREAQLLELQGALEVNLVAQDLAHYGRDRRDDIRLPELLESLLRHTANGKYPRFQDIV